MILNKFSTISFSRLRALSLQLLALSLFSCNKTANINANKSFVGITHVAYGVGPLTAMLDGTPLYSGTLSFGKTTGDSLSPYDTTTSRISDLVIREDSVTLKSGNSAFQQLAQYSIFVYDTLDRRSVNLIILQDNPVIRSDTSTYIRYLNFSPGTKLGLKLINNRNLHYRTDTIVVGLSLFVGYEPNPAIYDFVAVRVGTYNVFAFADSSMPNQDPSNDSSNFTYMGLIKIDSQVNYNVFLQGFFNSVSGIDSFQLKSVRLN